MTNQMTTTDAMSKLSLNAQVTMDDIVNILVSKHEEALYQRRQQVQEAIRSAMADQKKLGEAIRTMAKNEVFVLLKPLTEPTLTHASISIDVQPAETSDLDKVDYWDVAYEQTLKLPEGPVRIVNKNYAHESDKGGVFKTTMRVTVQPEQLEDWRQISRLLAEERLELNSVNAELQAVERKTRQVKAHLAQQKLQAEGMEALLAGPEIQNIMALPWQK